MPDPIDVVRDALEARQCSTRGRDHDFMAQCPAHDDGRPSLHVTASGEGTVLLQCYAGCTAEKIVEELGLEWGALFSRGADRDRLPEAEYTYLDADGRKLLQVVRFPGKDFRQRRWSGVGWVWGLRAPDGTQTRRELYHLPDVLKAKASGAWIFVCEGEKDADAVVAAGECGTTMPGGAGKWEPQYTETLAEGKVVILADDDEPGRTHAWAVHRQIYGKVSACGVRLPAEGHKDIADHLAAGLTLNGDLRKTERPTLRGAVAARLTVLTARLFAGTERPQGLELLGPLFQRGARTVIGAPTGEGKTTLALQAVKSLITGEPFLEAGWTPPHKNCRALLVDLEQGKTTLQRRLFEAGLETSERLDVLWEPNGIALDTREEDRAMVRDVIAEGRYDMVVFDPLYQMHAGSGNDQLVATRVLESLEQWRREFNCALIVPMHMRKPHPQAGNKISKNEIAGLGDWLRPFEVVLGLQVMSAGSSRLWFFKDRNGDGPALNSFWWLSFDRDKGFARTKKEERDRLHRAVTALLKDDHGVTMTQLLEAAEGDEVNLKRWLTIAHELDGRWRTKQWVGATPGQTTISHDV